MSFLEWLGFGSAPALTGSAAPQNVAVASPFSPSTLNSVVWPDIMGAPWAPMTRAEAMTVPAVARARMLIAGSIAQVPLHAYTGTDKAALQPAWIARTDGPLSPFHRMLWTIDDLLFFGWSLWSVSRDDFGAVATAGRVPFDRWDFDTDGHIEVDGSKVNNDQVILIPGVSEGLVNNAARSIRHASKLINAAEVAAETPIPALELHQTNDAPMTPEAIAELCAQWAAARKGTNGGVAYTNSAIQLIEHGSPSEQLLIDGRNAAAVDIARACGLPAAMLDATGPTASLTYETTEGRTRELIDFGLAPYLAAVSSRLSLDDMTLPATHVAFDVETYIGVSTPAHRREEDGTAE